MRTPFLLLLITGLLFASVPACAQQSPREGDKLYQPESGQPGKDVVWVPTPPALVTAMLQAARVGPKDYVVDLGSGDGRLTIAAAREFGARAHGIEYNPDLVALAKRNAERAGVAQQATFVEADIFKSDFTSATVVTLYLLPTLNIKLRPTLLAMKPGTRIVSHAFDMGDWEPDQRIEADGQQAFLWIVPARIDGTWQFDMQGKKTRVTLSQNYQNLSATNLVRSGKINGTAVEFTLADGQRLTGTLTKDNILSGKGWQAIKTS
jgi:SAM-dependent methyltransferase